MEGAEFCRKPQTRVSCHDRRLSGKRSGRVFFCSTTGKVNKIVPDLSTVVVWCLSDQHLSRELWVFPVWSLLFSYSPALLLVSPRLSREIQGILAVAGMRFVVAALATWRPRSLTCPHRAGSLKSGSANVVLSTGGRPEVGQSSGVRTFKQEMWRVCVCVCVVLCRCVAPKYGEWFL